MVLVPVGKAAEIEGAIGRFSEPPKAAMISLVDSFLVVNRQAIVAATAKYRVPMIYPFHYFMRPTSLMSASTGEVYADDGTAGLVSIRGIP